MKKGKPKVKKKNIKNSAAVENSKAAVRDVLQILYLSAQRGTIVYGQQ